MTFLELPSSFLVQLPICFVSPFSASWFWGEAGKVDRALQV